jgi:hypothetical protein
MTRSRDTASIIPTVDAKGDLLVGTADNTIDNLSPGTNGQLLTANSATATGLEWTTQEGYRFVQTLYFTSDGSFTKATYPWLKAIRVKCQGAGAAGWGSTVTTRQRPGGGGGGFAESLITDISGLDSSVTVTIGAGGIGNTGGGSSGGTSSFGSLVSATGGVVVSGGILGGLGGVGTGQLSVPGSAGGAGTTLAGVPSGSGGDSVFGSGGRFLGLDSNGESGRLYGGGGAGASANTTQPFNGGTGANGIVIVELYA